jgi:glutamine amidotransferase
MISVLEYGVGNVGSILNMIRRAGHECEPVSSAEGVAAAERLILPGVGSFDFGMRALSERNLVEPIKEAVRFRGMPLLGVCLGMQMLCEGSDEGLLPGLGFIAGRCRRFLSTPEHPLKVPHMGWSPIRPTRDHPLLTDLAPRSRFYFVHSFHAVCTDPADRLAAADYGIEFSAMISRGSVVGAQFHPEKSHRFGMAMLSRFAELSP